MGIKCGHCGQQHTTVNQVKACGSGTVIAVPTGPAMATERQEAFIRTLLEQRDCGEALRTEVAKVLDDTTVGMTKAQASGIIDNLMKLDKVPAKSGNGRTLNDVLANVPAGYYAIDSLTGNNDLDFVRVGLNQGRFNAADKGKKRIQRYLGGQGAIAIEWAEQRKFAEALAALDDTALIAARTTFGTRLGRCGCCGKSLTDQLSRAMGIGPECRKQGASL